VSCPVPSDGISCQGIIQEREIRALLVDEDFAKFMRLGLGQCESRTANSYHCKTANCQYWFENEGQLEVHQCPVCKMTNCLKCEAIHEGKTCGEFKAEQDRAELLNSANKDIQATKEMLDSLLAKGEAMHCPTCRVIVAKTEGCDAIMCSLCKTAICWITKSPRWGPKGKGDTSGGCKCVYPVKLCHPKCGNCH
jgi:RanBP-type and C3HC4-type zinc finger-containing protein 1